MLWNPTRFASVSQPRRTARQARPELMSLEGRMLLTSGIHVDLNPQPLPPGHVLHADDLNPQPLPPGILHHVSMDAETTGDTDRRTITVSADRKH